MKLISFHKKTDETIPLQRIYNLVNKDVSHIKGCRVQLEIKVFANVG